MKIRATFEITDDNGNTITALGSLNKDYVTNENQDLEYELVHSSTGGPHMRPKEPPKSSN